MATRNRSSGFTYQNRQTYLVYSKPYFPDDLSSTVNLQTGGSWSSSITDDISASNHYRNHTCTHIKNQTYLVPLNASYPCNSGHTVSLGSGSFSAGPFTTPLIGSLFSAIPSQTSFNSWAVDQFSYQVPSNLSIANFLLELDDLPKLWQTLQKLKDFGFKSIRDYNRFYKRSLKSGSISRIGYEATGVAADTWLSYAFGLKPLVDDITKSLNVVDKTFKRLKFLQRNYGKPVTVRRRRSFSVDPLPPFTGGGTYPGIRYGGISCKVTDVVGCTMYQTLKDLNDPIRLYIAFTHSLGFNKPGEIVWNAIPFSFLVDWVSDVSNATRALSAKTVFSGEYAVTNGWSSRKTVEHIGIEHRWGKGPNQTTDFIPSAYVVRSTYKRNPSITTNQGVSMSTDLSKGQFLSLASLIRQGL